MLSPLPGMDPFIEKNPIFHELHTQMLAESQGLLQPQLRPKFVAPSGWHHQLYTWSMRDPLPTRPIPLLGADRAALDLSACFQRAYDRIAADDEAGYDDDPPPPALKPKDRIWVDRLLRKQGSRR